MYLQTSLTFSGSTHKRQLLEVQDKYTWHILRIPTVLLK